MFCDPDKMVNACRQKAGVSNKLGLTRMKSFKYLKLPKLTVVSVSQ